MLVRSLTALLLLTVVTGVSAQDDTLKIATFNIRYANDNDGEDVWTHRIQAVTEFAKQNDIIGMQEVRKGQFDTLRENLSAFGSYGVGRDDGKQGGEHAVIFYRKDRFEPIDKGTFWLSETPDVVGQKGWDAALPRTCTWILLRNQKTKQPIYVANTHFDHRGSKARLGSGELLAKRIGAQPQDMPVVVMGDLNCLPGSGPYEALAAVFSDARKVSQTPPSGPTSTWNGFRAIAPDRIIDHIFVRNVDVLKLATLDPKTDQGRFASDHLPVQITITQ
ncbi:endonuclease/exonuclease/phosphatase family protein [Stieleria sp. TO1_6]|uniref:endonuclease/exonuclease/phosphatase family protein n=1 Tax=Stieleria tagensis TaxID=2956795 RepID=UPI00209A90B1|nr:endonuclease/exonuclease/phosphatase family protein [Stieleria tagensis]MCO8122441.1 endonuclease/exonuclease/phosphatase family protein [Stieleria tagensis]